MQCKINRGEACMPTTSSIRAQFWYNTGTWHTGTQTQHTQTLLLAYPDSNHNFDHLTPAALCKKRGQPCENYTACYAQGRPCRPLLASIVYYYHTGGQPSSFTYIQHRQTARKPGKDMATSVCIAVISNTAVFVPKIQKLTSILFFCLLCLSGP